MKNQERLKDKFIRALGTTKDEVIRAWDTTKDEVIRVVGPIMERGERLPDLDKPPLDACLDPVENGPAESGKKEHKANCEWHDMYHVMRCAEKLVVGQELNAKRYQSEDAKAYRNTELEPMLAALTETTEATAKKECQYRRATVILQGYYPNDKIYDFVGDLLGTWNQDLTDVEPREYASELYQNSLHNIRYLFYRMQERLKEAEPQVSKTRLQQRLWVLERSEPPLCELAQSIREARSIYNRATKGLNEEDIPSGVEEPGEFIRAARRIASLLLNKKKITREKLESLYEAVKESLQNEELRIRQMQPDIDRADKLYSMLCDVLAGEENTRLLDSLNPKTGALEDLTAEQIRERYSPLIRKLEEITEVFQR